MNGYPPAQGYAAQAAYASPGYPPVPAYAPQPSYAAPQAAYAPQPGYAPPAPMATPAPAPASPLRPFPLVMQLRLTRLTGQMFVAPSRLYFICESTKGGLGVALGKGLGGLVGGAIMAFAAPTPGQAAPVIDENTLQRAAAEQEGSLIMEPAKIDKIKDTFWTHAIWFEGRTYALPNGLDKELKRELGLWCQANNVKSGGLLPK